MDYKKKGPTHTQTLGIVWLSVALLTIAAVAFFSSRHNIEVVPNDTSEVLQQDILTTKEDSVYRIRRTYSHNTHRTNKKYRPDTSFYTIVPPAPTKQPLVVELNSADSLTLQLLHGIGPAYARRIVRYRERLGGFTSTEQLLEVYGFTPELLEHLLPHLTLDTMAVRRIDINHVELKQLAMHPYMEYYQARDIVRLRNSGVLFRNADDLRAVPSMADSTLRRILPYIDFGEQTLTTQ